jgi:hypothetical protein
MLFGLGHLFIGINNSKATGLAAIAGGMAEMLVTWGLATLIISQVVAIFWLFRSFSKDNMPRNLISLFSIFASGIILLLVGGLLWIERYSAHHP